MGTLVSIMLLPLYLNFLSVPRCIFDLRPNATAEAAALAHRVWTDFLVERFAVIRHRSAELFRIYRDFLYDAIRDPEELSYAWTALGTRFRLLTLCNEVMYAMPVHSEFTPGFRTRTYRAALLWFLHDDGHCRGNRPQIFYEDLCILVDFAQWVQYDVGLAKEVRDGSDDMFLTAGPSLRKQGTLLLVLLGSEMERLLSWYNPLGRSELPAPDVSDFLIGRDQFSKKDWADLVRIAWRVAPRLAIAFGARFGHHAAVRNMLEDLVVRHATDVQVRASGCRWWMVGQEEGGVALRCSG